MNYLDFLASKTPRPEATGLASVPPLAAHLFDYQAACVDFALRQGRSGLFLDTGLGKTLVELEFATHAAAASNGLALLLTPLAVARQIEREAIRFGYDARVIRDQSEARPGISICNYDRLEKLDPDAFGAVVLDESSILKSFTGKTRRGLTQAFAHHRWRMAATATPAPNDHMELGQHAEFLGVMTGQEMLSMFFVNNTSTASQEWRIKGHAREAFWDWMASWSRCAETPEDLGFDGSRFVLPPLNVIRHKAQAANIKPLAGTLFALDTSATAIHDIKRQTANDRADAVAALVAADPVEPWVIWCDTDYEADALTKSIPGAVEVRGSHHADKKESTLAGFADGSVRVLVTKPSVAGMGLNWQHCARVVYAGRSFSYEAWYQSVRRCWRFGQKRRVDVHLIVAEGEDQISRVIDRKAGDHATMKREMAAAMKRAVGSGAAAKVPFVPTHKGRLPAWLTA